MITCTKLILSLKCLVRKSGKMSDLKNCVRSIQPVKRCLSFKKKQIHFRKFKIEKN